jgi:hypothetical protein
VKRVVVLGRGGAGKSVLAQRIGKVTGLPVTELDQIFWSSDLRPTPRDRWDDIQRELVAGTKWVLDADLGHNDSLQPRLASADTVIILDFGVLRCAWRAIRRSRERTDFWWWLLSWKRRSRPTVVAAVARWAPDADVHVLRSPHDVDQFLAAAATSSRKPIPNRHSRRTAQVAPGVTSGASAVRTASPRCGQWRSAGMMSATEIGMML